MRKIRPIGDRVLVKRLEEEDKIGNVIVPDTAKKKSQQAEVIAVGSEVPEKKDKDKDKKTEDIPLKKGDKILLGEFTGTEITIDDEEYVFVDKDDVLAVIEK